MKKSVYKGMRAALATMHHKEQVIIPHIGTKIGIEITVPDVNTDSLGTFSGEIKRQKSMLETAVAKAHLGMEKEGFSLGIASEGSFGPHPAIPFIPANYELIVFVDTIHKQVIYESMLSQKTNFGQLILSTAQAPIDFLKRVLFPSHGLMVSSVQSCQEKIIYKGITNNTELEKAINTCFALSENQTVLLETDMRAHMNPTRMSSIELVAKRLAKKIVTHCPSCAIPGFGVVRIEAGLPCKVCFMPTENPYHRIVGCAKCPYTEVLAYKKNIAFADPAQCGYCNP